MKSIDYNSKHNTDERILLLTDVPPCKNYTGGLMSSQLIRFLIEEKKDVYCFCVKSTYVIPEYWDDINDNINMEIIERPEENTETGTKKYYNQINKIKKQLIEYVRKNKITKIWCPVQGEVLTILLNYIYEITKIPYIVQIWDPIEWWIKEHGFDEERKNKTLEEYGHLINNSEKCITTSFEMSKYYNEKYNKRCIEVMPSLKLKPKKNNNKKNDKSKFIIALCGQIYAKDETDKLLSALDSINWKYKGKDIYFEHFGTWSDTYIDSNKHRKYLDRIIKRGFYKQDELVNELMKVDLLYCPYFFSDDEILKMVSKLSFPSKLITYLMVGTPILLHAPEYSSPYIFAKETNSCYLVNTLESNEIIRKIKYIIENDSKVIIQNAQKAFENNFTTNKMKKEFFKALNIPFDEQKKLNILEVNNVDLPGRRFNGYDLQEEINNNTRHSARQIVTYKTSDNKNVIPVYKYSMQLSKEWNLLDEEAEILSVHSQLSIVSDMLLNNDYFNNSDLVHYHLIHNMKLSLSSFNELCSKKPTVWTLHDPWPFTGRCVYPQECEKWKDGCEKCECLDNLFPLKKDNCNSLWKQKREIYKDLDIDIIVTTPYMKKMLETSPLTKHWRHVHVVPFGIDLNKFNNTISKQQARKKLGINESDIVLFFRAQLAMKGTEYIIEALKKLKTNKKITLLTCSEVGLLEELKNTYNIIDLGDIQDDQMVVAYNACDVFLMPSKGESFGLMAIEAMACSKPIIVFNNSALPYVTFAPDCGYLVENKNSHKLMEAIKYLIDNEDERIKRGKLGRKLAEKNYNIDDYNRKIIEVYEKAYERQKNKTRLKKDDTIDYELRDVKELNSRLNYIYNKIFPGDKLSKKFTKKDIIYDNDFKIDYSLISVRNLINRFNKKMYENTVSIEENFVEIERFSKIKKFIFLYINDRKELKDRICNHLSGHKILYRVLRIIYRVLRGIKHIIFRNKICKMIKK